MEEGELRSRDEMKTEGFALRGEFLRPFLGGPVCRPYGMVWGGASGRPRPTWDGISGTGGSGSRPYGESGSGPFFFVGAGHWPARRRASAIPEPNLIRLAYARHLPLKGKAVGRVVAPPLQRITERMRSFRRGRSQTGPRAAQCAAPTDLIRLALLGTCPYPLWPSAISP